MDKLNIRKILLPVDFPNTSLRVIHQAAILAHHFNAEIEMLHVATPQSHAYGVPDKQSALASWDMRAEVIKIAEQQHDEALASGLEGLTIRYAVSDGEPAAVVTQAAYDEDVDLIMMPSVGQTFDRFLLDTKIGQLRTNTECPLWTSALVGEAPEKPLTLQNILCCVYLAPHDELALTWAARMADDFGSCLTIAHVTAAVDFWGPGGTFVNPKWKETLVSDAKDQIADLQKKVGTKAEVFVGSGILPKVLSIAAKEMKADLLVNASHPYGTNLRTNGYAVICAVPIPVLSV